MGGELDLDRAHKDARLTVDRNSERRLQAVIVIVTSGGMIVLTLAWWLVEARFMWPALVVGVAMPLLLLAIRRVDASLTTRGGSGLSAPEGQSPSAFEKAVTAVFVAALVVILIWMMIRIL